MGGYRRHVIVFSFKDIAISYAAFNLSGDSIAVSRRVFRRIHEETFLHRLEVAADFHDFFHKQARPLFDFSGFFSQIAVLFQLHHFHQAVQSHQSLLGVIAGFDVVNMPWNVSSFIRGDGGLDVRSGQLGNKHVQHMADSRFSRGGTDIFGIFLRAHFIAVTDVPQRYRVRQVHVYTRRRRSRWRNGGKTDVFRLDSNLFREQSVDGMLYDQLRHNLPGFSGCSVGIVGAVNLQNIRPLHDLLGLAGVYKGTHAVNIPVQHVVLRILMGAVDSFFREHYRNIRACHAGNIGVIVNRTADFIFDNVQSFSLSAHLFSGNRHAADSLRRSFHQTVNMGLPHMADYHNMIRSMPRRHPHSADIVLKSSGSDFRCNDRVRLRIDVAEVFGGRKPYAVFQRFGAVMVLKRPHFQIVDMLSPGPASSSRFVFIQILQDLSYIQLFIGFKFKIRHSYLPPFLNIAETSSQPSPFASRSPASLMEMFLALDSLYTT